MGFEFEQGLDNVVNIKLENYVFIIIDIRYCAK